MATQTSLQRLLHSEFGNPREVLSHQVKNQETALAEGEALLGMLYANINPSDMGMIGGSYGKLPELPTTPGREGVARVLETCGNSDGINVGDIVRIPESCGAWQSHSVAKCTDLFRIPPEIDPKQAATLFINPTTALMLLESVVDLKEGDWVIQNAANSSVGVWVIQLARALGYKTINIVRRSGLENELKALGADVVVVDSKDYPKSIKNYTGGSKPRLALNSIGGESVNNLIKSLDDGGTCVTFGGMVGDPIRFPTRFLIFNDVLLCGFWMDKWMKTHDRDAIEALYQRVYRFVIENKIHTPIESVYPLEHFKEALENFSKPRMGKVLFEGDVS
jgi:trans-2-enoyl-CoA reductase